MGYNKTMKRLVFIMGIIGFCLTLSSGGVCAADRVSVRVGAHKDYSRLVVDWPQKQPYEIRASDDTHLVLSFNKAADFAIEGLDLSAVDNIEALAESKTDQGVSLTMTIPAHTTHRHFTVGARVIVDIYNPPAQKTDDSPKQAEGKDMADERIKTQDAQQDEMKTAEHEGEDKAPPHDTAGDTIKEEEEPAGQPAAEDKPAIIRQDIPEDARAVVPALSETQKNELRSQLVVDDFDRNTPVIKKKTAADKAVDTEDDHKLSVLEQAQKELEAQKPYLISLTRTEAVGLSAFIRNGRLWMVFDQEDLKFSPYVSGPDETVFSKFQKQKILGGVAYHTEFPDKLKDYYIYGEGGGLAWRLVVTKNKRDSKPVDPQSKFAKKETVWGGETLWPFPHITKILKFRDPAIGDLVNVLTVSDSAYFSGPSYRFPAYEVFRAPVGMAFAERVDDLEISYQEDHGVTISRGMEGLALSREDDRNRRIMREQVAQKAQEELQDEDGVKVKRIFDFDRWMMGGIQALQDNQGMVMRGLADKEKSAMVEDIITLAKLNIANDRGPEAAGFLHLAAMELPPILESPEYIALRGAAYGLAGKCAFSLRDFSHEKLKDYGEADYWRTYALACLEDWNQAQMIMPNDFSVVISYPKELQEKIALKLAEVALRNADIETAEGLLSILEIERNKLRKSTLAGLDYLKGEAARQNGDFEGAKLLWQPLAHPRSYDDLYRVKAGLAMTLLEWQKGDIEINRAINRLEGLRYAWRGDELESKVNFTLGQLYLRDRQYLKGLGILRDAAAMRPETRIGQEIAAYMKRYFYELLMMDEELSPLDAAAVYEEFIELTPPGDKGNKVVQKLAERLAEADLLERSAALLQHQVDFRLQGSERAAVSFRLATIYLLDKKPKEAMIALNEANVFYVTDASEEAAEKRHAIALLKARALSQLGRADEAIARLNTFDPAPDVNRLRADLAWRAGMWDEAAVALQDLIFDQALNAEKLLTEDQAHLILNRAVALNLSGNRVGLANIRERYGAAMKKTARGRMFDVVTRPRSAALFADKETITGLVAEVDIFQDFLKSYRLEDIDVPRPDKLLKDEWKLGNPEEEAKHNAEPEEARVPEPQAEEGHDEAHDADNHEAEAVDNNAAHDEIAH